jgi:hypothetical protein
MTAAPAARVLPHRYELMPVDKLTPHPDNANIGDVVGIAGSIQAVGFWGVVLVHEATGHILAGEHRWRAAVKSGLADVPSIVIDCDEETARDILVGDNEWARQGKWDQGKLVALLQRMSASGRSLAPAGFGGDKLARLLGERRQAEPPRPALADRFVVPPFDVLDGRSGWWRDRKAAWLALGIESELGRLAGDSSGAAAMRGGPAGWLRADPGFYAKKARAEEALGRELSTAEFVADWYDKPAKGVGSGISIFDPVLCELVYRWFSPPGGAVLDPFAGGSVRGLVAAMLGHPYLGCDLSPAQVAANEQQAAAFAARGLIGAPPGPALSPADITPVEEHGGFQVKRDDLFGVRGSMGGKARTCWALATALAVNGAGFPTGAPLAGLVTAGSRQSPQVNIVAAVAAELGVPCRVHVPSGDLTPELLAARAHGAEVVQHRPGRNSVIIARARADAAERGWLEVPFGMECPEAVEATAAQAAELPPAARYVVPVGSGMTLAGVLAGLERAGNPAPVLGVVCGADPARRLDRWAPGWRARCTLVGAGMDYHRHAAQTRLGGLELDPIYEAKCLPHLRAGDLLWVVGRRETVGGAPALPAWACADSVGWAAQLPPESADLVFTCPPYYDLEQYSDDPADLSAMPPEAFDAAWAAILGGCARALRPDRFAVVVTGDTRGRGGGAVRDLRGATIAAAAGAGLAYCSGAVLLTPIGSVPYAAARLFTGTRGLGRCHQDVLVFCKGDRGAAARACGEVPVELPPGMAPEQE